MLSSFTFLLILLKFSRRTIDRSSLPFPPLLNLLTLDGLLTPSSKFKIYNIFRMSLENLFHFLRIHRKDFILPGSYHEQGRKMTRHSLKTQSRATRVGLSRHCWDVRQLSVRQSHISRTVDYVVFSRSRALSRARANDSLCVREQARCAATLHSLALFRF